MSRRVITRPSWRHVLLLSAILGLASVAGQVSVTGAPLFAALAGGSSDRPARASGITAGETAPNAPLSDAFLLLAPGTGGSVPAPPNGGSVPLGSRFVLDLMLDSGSHTDLGAQQSYLTFTSSILQNARVSDIDSACIPTSTVTEDLSTFEVALQNEVCNGPGNCVFRAPFIIAPGSLAWASGAFGNCPTGCGGSFRVAQIGLCAVGPGQAVLHWQFSPPAPATRDTEIADMTGSLVHEPALFSDYTFNVVAPTSTPTPAPVPDPLLKGHVIWEGRPAQPNPLQQLPISLTLRLASGGPYYDYSFPNTDAGGYFTLPVAGLPMGTYDWRVKNPQYLANSGTVTLSGWPLAQVEMGLTLAGDVNGNNLVSLEDFLLLSFSFGFACGSPWYQPMADFTGDCVVNTLDFNLLRSNFAHAGAPPIGP